MKQLFLFTVLLTAGTQLFSASQEQILHNNLLRTSIYGYLNEVDHLLKTGAREVINCKTSLGDTALTIASNHGHTTVVEKLLANGADPSMVDIHGNTALHFAAMRNKTAVVELFLKYAKPKSSTQQS